MIASSFCETVFDYGQLVEKVKGLDARMAQSGFWDNQESAQGVVSELKSLNATLKPLQELMKGGDDLKALLELAEQDDSFAAEVPAEVERLSKLVDEAEVKALLNGPNDGLGAIITINARDGGTDANDWAEMLLRMYLQWAKANDYDAELLDRQDNEEAGIKSASAVIRGPMAYGYLRGETGMHRLVRMSPFNADAKRQTSFAAVDVSPEINDNVEVEINDEDIREDTYSASGPGGQHVNKTQSAVRLTHLPTGIVAQCQNERSQHKNRATAMKMLRARLARLEEEKREQEMASKYNSQAKSGFGNQIRNYFLHPDQIVKDTRSGHKCTNFQRVLDGDLQDFLDAYLAWKAGGEVADDK